MTYRDAQDAPARPPKSADGGYESDEDFLRGDDKPREKRRRSAAGSFMRILLILIILVAAIGGGLYAAIHFRLVDPVQIGLGGILGGGAAGPSRPTAPTVEADVIFAGDSTQLAAAPGNSVQADETADIAWLRTTVKAASASGVTDGVTVVIPRDILPRFEGRRARITISARSGAEGDPVPFAAAYSAGPKGNSNWVVFVPEKQFSEHSFSFVIPIGDLAGSDDHRIAIWSDIEGRGVPLGIRSITIRPD